MPRFASSVSSLRSSEIRDLMSVAAAPDIISFSGGMPGNDLFPLDSLDEIYRSLTDKEKQVALQYGPTNGLPSMLEWLEAYLVKKGLPVKENRLMMTTGSLQAIHILPKHSSIPVIRFWLKILLLLVPCLLSVPMKLVW